MVTGSNSYLSQPLDKTYRSERLRFQSGPCLQDVGTQAKAGVEAVLFEHITIFMIRSKSIFYDPYLSGFLCKTLASSIIFTINKQI